MNSLINSGDALFNSGNYYEALSIYTTILQNSPNNPQILAKIGLIHQINRNFKDAINFYQKALHLNSNLTNIYNNLGCIFRDIGDYESAIQCFKRDNDSYEKFFNLGILFEKYGDIKSANKFFHQALKFDHSKGLSVMTKIALLLPPIYNSKEEILKSRKKISDFIDRYSYSESYISNPTEDIGATTFYLGYHGECNKSLNNKIYKFFKKRVAANFFAQYQPKDSDTKKSKRIKIGFVSTFFRKHSVSDVSRGWIANLNKEIFEVIIFSIGYVEDDSILYLKKNCSKFIQLPSNIKVIQKSILENNLNILFFTDIGLEPYTYFLAMSKLAPLQITYTGHPHTTGIETIDYYISSKHWEVANGQDFYTEKLVKFDSLTWYYDKPQIKDEISLNFEDFGLSKNDKIYCINQSLFKIHPDFDYIINKITTDDENSKIILFYNKKNQQWREQLIGRFRKSISKSEKIIFIEELPFNKYLCFLKLSDVILDTIYFNGGTTSLQSFAVSTPIVTLPGNLACSRFTYGMYHKMGITYPIAEDFDDYVTKAILIANNKELNIKLRSDISLNNQVLFCDRVVIDEFEKFFLDITKK